jgi:hypothetical protein
MYARTAKLVKITHFDFLFNLTLDGHVEYRNTYEYTCLSILLGRNDRMLFLNT